MSSVFIELQNKKQYSVQDGDLLLPQIGNWSAHLSFADAEEEIQGKVTLTWLGKPFTGFVIPTRSGVNEGRYSALVVGGAGNLSKIIPHKMYDYGLALKLPLQEILSEAGEQLSPTSDLAILSTTLPNWIRTQDEAWNLLSTLADQVGAIWRVLPDGSIYFGKNIYTQNPGFEFDLLAPRPTCGSAVLSLNQFGVLPGQNFPVTPLEISQKRIVSCQYKISPSFSHLVIWFADGLSDEYGEPIKSGLAAFIKETMRYVDYLGTYSGKAILQRENGTIDITPDSPRFPSLTSVPVDTLIGGTKIIVKAGDRVNFWFKNGDPTKYTAGLCEPGSGGRLLARKDGEVDGGSVSLTVAGMGVTIAGTYTDGFGNVTTMPAGPTVTFSIKGKIKDGWTRWEVGND